MNITLLWFPVFQNRVLFASVFQIHIYWWLLSDYFFFISSGTIDCFKDCEGNLHRNLECSQPLYLPIPTQETQRQAEKGFWERWKFPNCIGSIDRKHVKIKCPPQSGSHFYCYKHFPSIVLLAVVDPRYQFLVIDVGAYRRQSDSWISEKPSFYRCFIHGKNILPPKPLPGTDIPIPHVLLGHEGFGLHMYLMRPFPKTTIVNDIKGKKFNVWLSRAIRVVENTFRILTKKWRIFLRPINDAAKTATNIVKAACKGHPITGDEGPTGGVEV
jgi:hypothetical protein